MASSQNLLPGMTLAVFYVDDTVWHERLLLWQLSPGCWYILTPDLDLYPEDLTMTGGDGPVKIKVKGKDFRYWSRVGGTAYRFAEPVKSDEVLKSYIKQAFREGQAEESFDPDWRPEHIMDAKGGLQKSSEFLGSTLVPRRMRGRGTGILDGAPADSSAVEVSGAKVGPIVPASDSHVWLCLENIDDLKFGQTVGVNPATDLMIDDHTGLVRTRSGWAKVELWSATEAPEFLESRKMPSVTPPAAPVSVQSKEPSEESSGDARALFVDFDAQGMRYKEWRTVVQESVEYSYPDWPHSGPTTVLHLLKHMHKYGGDPKQWLELWCRQKGISEQDRVKHELRCLMEAFYLGGTYDQLNLPVISAFETIARRVQCIVDAYAQGSSSSPDWGNARLFTGYVGPDDLIMPQLKSWAARKGKEEVELFQARNRMRDLRRTSSAAEEAAGAAADGNVPAGGNPKPKRRARGKGLEPPAAP